MGYRMLGLDIDGTLLDARGALTREAREAITEARRRGIFVVLCTGRRFRTAALVAEDLDLTGPLVVNNGVLVKDLESGLTLHADYLPRRALDTVLPLMREAGSPMLYLDGREQDTDILVERRERAHRYQLAYLDDHGEHARFVDDLARHAPDEVVMVSLMGDEETLAELRGRASQRLDAEVRINWLANQNYPGRILEFLSASASKWSGLSRVAQAAGIDTGEIAAIGDDTNDVEMLAGAGLGIAMGSAPREVQAAADRVVAAGDAGGLVEAIELLLRRL